MNLEFLEIASLHPSMTKILEFPTSLRGVSETNDEAISFKIPSKIPSLRGSKATEARNPLQKIQGNSRIPKKKN